MPKLVLARGDIAATDELVIILNQPDNEPAAVLIVWPPAASVASPTAFPAISKQDHRDRRQRRRTARTAQSQRL
jgi:hypothetical protein